MKFILVIISLLTSLVSFSQQPELNPIKWNVVYSPLPNLEGEIIITATIENKWHIIRKGHAMLVPFQLHSQ